MLDKKRGRHFLFAIILLIQISQGAIVMADDKSIISINQNSRVLVYFIPFDVYTRIPVTEEYIRKNYSIMLESKGEYFPAIQKLVNSLYGKSKKYESNDVRLLIDVFNSDIKIATISISEKKVLDDVDSYLFKALLSEFMGLD